ncbi:hypothetical protein PTKU15_80180 [Paraburkholderia terrae]|nr:hypothetical protein PTKU15_80180 [Paraburkholderia terrae]
MLRKESIAELLGPVELVIDRLENLWECNERFHADIPRLVFDGLYCGVALDVAIGLDLACRVYNLQRIGRHHRNR